MYEWFSGQARRAMQLARHEAQRFRQEYVGTEHILLGVLREEFGGVRRLLVGFGREPAPLLQALEPQMTQGSLLPSGEQLPLTPSARRLLDSAHEVARQLGHEWVAPEHLFLAILRDVESTA